MNALLFSILITDILLIVAIAVLVVKINNLFRHKGRQFQEYGEELRHLMEESEKAATSFFTNMKQTTDGLLDILKSLAEKQQNLEKLLQDFPVARKDEEEKYRNLSKYDSVIQMLRQGLPEETIREKCGLPEAEIDLVLELYRKKKDIPGHLMDLD